MESSTSRISTVIYKCVCLHQKQKSRIQFIFIFCNELLLFSKHVEFLSFQTVHHMLAGTVLHLALSLTSHPASSQLSKVADRFPGIVHVMPLRARNILHIWPVILQCWNRCLIVTVVPPHKVHLLHIVIPLFIRLSCQKPDKTIDLKRYLGLPNVFQGPLFNLVIGLIQVGIGYIHFINTTTMTIPP